MLNIIDPLFISQTSKFYVSSPHYCTFACFIGLA
jgi:hypothetical protein